MELAAKIAVNTVSKFLEENKHCIGLVEWVLFDEKTEKIYEAEINKLQLE